MHKGHLFTSTQTSKVANQADEGGLGVSHYTIEKVATSDSGAYTCAADYNAGGTKTSPTAVTLEVVGMSVILLAAIFAPR